MSRLCNSVCAEAQRGTSVLTNGTCGVIQLTPALAYQLGYAECAKYLAGIIDAVLHKSGGAKWEHNKGDSFVDGDLVLYSSAA